MAHIQQAHINSVWGTGNLQPCYLSYACLATLQHLCCILLLGSEVFTVEKIYILDFWVMILRSLVQDYQSFGEKYCLQLHGTWRSSKYLQNDNCLPDYTVFSFSFILHVTLQCFQYLGLSCAKWYDDRCIGKDLEASTNWDTIPKLFW
jgi:hypothetical protein